MNKKDEALKMAIDYLHGSYDAHKIRKICQEALNDSELKNTTGYCSNCGEKTFLTYFHSCDEKYQPKEQKND